MWDHFLFPFPSPLLCVLVEFSGSALQLSRTPITRSLLIICRTEAMSLSQRRILFPADNHSVQMRKGKPQLLQTVFTLAVLMTTHRPLQIFENVNTNGISWGPLKENFSLSVLLFLCSSHSVFYLHWISQNVLYQCYYRSKFF